MATVVNITYQLKRGNSSRWLEVNPVLKQGEPGFEVDTGRLKIGNGIDTWVDLDYIGDTNDCGIISVETKDMFPDIGDVNFIYRVIDEKNMYQWNSDLGIYELMNSVANIEVNVNDLINRALSEALNVLNQTAYLDAGTIV